MGPERLANMRPVVVVLPARRRIGGKPPSFDSNDPAPLQMRRSKVDHEGIQMLSGPWVRGASLAVDPTVILQSEVMAEKNGPEMMDTAKVVWAEVDPFQVGLADELIPE